MGENAEGGGPWGNLGSPTLIAVGLARVSLPTALWSLGGVAAFTVVAYSLTAAILGHSSLGIVDGTIQRTTWLRGSVSCPRSSVARVVEVPLSFTPLGYGERFLLFLGRDDETLMPMPGTTRRRSWRGSRLRSRFRGKTSAAGSRRRRRGVPFPDRSPGRGLTTC